MSKRLALVLAALLAIGVTAFAGAGPAAAVVPTCDCAPVYTDGAPLSPDNATALVNAAGTGGLVEPVAVDPATVLAAAAAPGADTSIAPGLTPEQAAGLITTAGEAVRALGPPMCWADHGWWTWGTWPYEQKLNNITYWCANYGSRITLRTSTVTAGGTLCAVSWRASALIGGGVGFDSFTMRSAAGWACPTDIPWITLHPSHHMDIRFDDRGGAAIVDVG